MSFQSNKNQTDLPKSWHATSIAVKITAVVVWGVMPIAFAITIPLLSSLENEISKDYWWKLEQTHIAINQTFLAQPDISHNDLHQHVIKLKDKINFDYFNLQYRQNNSPDTISIGKQAVDASVYSHRFGAFVLTLSFPSIERGIELERMKYGSFIVLFTVILGLYLVYVIRNVLHAPFQRVIDATQNVIAGNLETRLDIKSNDEFGHLSLFFNHMIEELAAQQQCLTDANQYLESVIKNKDMALAESRSKSLFLANMSHEIRTPMTAILGYAEMLNHFGINDKKEQKEALETIYRNSKHLITIINDILDLSKIEADKLQVEAISFSPMKVINEVNQLMSLQAKEKGVRLEIEYDYPLPEVISNDPTRFKQILFNLIANALRFTSDGAVIVKISCSFEQQKLYVSVADNGIGLSDEQITRLFQPYVQAKVSIARQYGGTGLGLMIAKRLVNLMGGDVRVNSVVGEGAVFEFDISTGDLSNTEQRIKVTDNDLFPVEDFNHIPEFSGKILLVEDIIDNQKLISMYVNQSGLEIDIANNGKEGLNFALSHEYDLILMDMQMPVMDGLTATRKLRESNYQGSIIALTANVLKNEREVYLQAGCNAILSKPIIIDEFYSTIQTWLKPVTKKQTTIKKKGNSVSQSTASIKPSHTKKSVNQHFQRLVEQFLSSLKQEIIDIEALIKQENWAKCQKMFHNIKGRGGSFGFPEMTRWSAELEDLLKSEHYDEIEEKFNLFKEYAGSLSDGSLDDNKK